MKKLINFSITVWFLWGAISWANEVKVRFEVVVPNTLKPFTRVFIAGNFNNWNPADSAHMMTEAIKNKFVLEFLLPEGQMIEYKYTLGGWATVEKAMNGTALNNRQVRIVKDLTQKDVVAKWRIESINHDKWALEDLGIIQTQFLQKNFSGQCDQAKTNAEIDKVISAAQTAWSNEAQVINADWKSLASNTYLFFLIDPAQRGVDNNRLLHILTAYWVPAFVEEYPLLAKEPNEQKGGMLVENEIIFLCALALEFPKAQWFALKNIYETLPAAIKNYLASVQFQEDRIKQHLQYMSLNLPLQKPLWEIRAAMYDEKLDLAFNTLKLALTESKNDPEYLHHLGMRLSDKFQNRQMPEKALTVLDLLTASTSDRYSSRDSLKAKYAQIDPQNGIKRFEKESEKRPKFMLSPKEKRFELSGTYTELVSDRSFDLASVKGKTVFLDFWTTWCPPCRAEIPALIAFQNKIKERGDFIFVSVCCDRVAGGKAEKEVKEFGKMFGVNYIVLFDNPQNSLMQRFGVNGFPSKFLLDESGAVLMESGDGIRLELVEAYLANKEQQPK